MRNSIRYAGLALFIVGIITEICQATKIDMGPRPTNLLTRSRQFIAQDAWNSVALYSMDDSKPIRRFPASASINEFEATVDEGLLLIACANGEIGVYKIDTGEKLWWRTSSQTGLGYIYDASFSWDGKTLVACNERDFLVIFNALTGEQIGKVSFPPNQTNIMSAALSPDGTKGVLVTLGGRLCTFDTNSGQMKDTGLTGAAPVRYSAGGKFIALRSNNSGDDEQLRIVAVENLATTDVGKFAHIGLIRAIGNSSFLACAYAGRRFENNAIVGITYQADSGELKEIWKLSTTDVENKTDFDPKQMIGLSTDYRFVTRLIDLQTGKPRLTIDNSANYRESIVSTSSRGLPFAETRIVWLVVVPLALAGCVVIYLMIKRMRINVP